MTMTPTCMGFELSHLALRTWKYKCLASLHGIMNVDIRFITSKSKSFLLRLWAGNEDSDLDFTYSSNCSRPIAINLKKMFNTNKKLLQDISDKAVMLKFLCINQYKKKISHHMKTVSRL
jgi:hypothetical protein